MFEKWNLSDELKAFVVKVLIPSVVAVSIKLAVMSKQHKITIMNVLLSFVTGVGTAYLFSGIVMDYFSVHWVPLIIACLTISGEKIGTYFIFKFKVDEVLDALYQKLIEKIKK